MAILKSRLFLKIMVSYVVLLLAVLVATYLYMAYRVHDNYIHLERQRLLTAARILARVLPADHSMAGCSSGAAGVWTPDRVPHHRDCSGRQGSR